MEGIYFSRVLMVLLLVEPKGSIRAQGLAKVGYVRAHTELTEWVGDRRR